MRPKSATAALRDEEVGQRIALARHEKGMSQSALAKKVKVSRDAVSQWERGINGISWEKLDLVADAVDRSAEWLRFGDSAFDHLPDRAGADQADVIKFVTEMRNELVHLQAGDPAMGTGAFLISMIIDMSNRLEQLEETVAGGSGLVGSTRRTKAMLAEGLDAEADDPATPAEPGTRYGVGAKQESAPARPAKKRRSASKRAR